MNLKKIMLKEINNFQFITENRCMIIKNILLYFSAFVPMYFLIVIKFLFGFISKMMQINALTIFTLSIYSTLVVIGILGLLWNTIWNKSKSEEIIITSKKNLTDKHFLGYFSIFVLFALAFELTKLSMVVVSLLIILFIGIVYVNNKMFYINPFLNILGFNFYIVKYKKNNSEKESLVKIFCRGELKLSQKYKVKLENINFSFVDKNYKK